jgi:hypothetical protein
VAELAPSSPVGALSTAPRLDLAHAQREFAPRVWVDELGVASHVIEEHPSCDPRP